jgi:hypothetical protein
MIVADVPPPDHLEEVMARNGRTAFCVLAVAVGAFLVMFASANARSEEKAAKDAKEVPRATLSEAKGQAKLLHDTFDTSLQMVHLEYYREDEGLPIPSLIFEDVFKVVGKDRDIKFHWIAVNAQPMSVDHRAKDDFEKAAVKELASGKESYEAVEGDVYRRAGAITLFSQCLKCHVPNRTSTESRTAGLVISIPIKND